jgi:hypothetical protein
VSNRGPSSVVMGVRNGDVSSVLGGFYEGPRSALLINVVLSDLQH